ncbi:hypothetical protein CDIK_1113 [Cucumispora dikerogammari]|nr:hypothetical protein CDIK_1113 [Cucumispora dikerogammari]
MGFLNSAASNGNFLLNSVLIMNNAFIYKTFESTVKYAKLGLKVLFLSLYSQELNSIENFFSSVKSRLYRIRYRASTRNELKANINEVLLSYNNKVVVFENLYLKSSALFYNILKGKE